MGYVKSIETDTLTLPSSPDYWVKIKRAATYGDQLGAQSAMLKLESAGSDVVSQMEWSAYIQALTISMTVEWNLTDEHDQPLPITAASLSKLSAEDGQFLASEVSSRAKTRSVEQERPFAGQSSSP